MAKSAKIESFWTMPLTALFERLDTAPTGLSETEAKQRLQLYGRIALNHQNELMR